VITSISPSTFIVGSAATTMNVYGTGFASAIGTNSTLIVATAQWNGTSLTTQGIGTAFNGTAYVPYLIVNVPANLLTSLGTASVTVTSSTATPALSNAVTATIANPPAPTLTSISPTSGPINTATTVNLYGTGFASTSTVALNGINIAATYVSSTQLTVAIPASSLTLPGNVNFTVTTPAPGGGTSAALPFTAYVGIVNNSMIYNPANGLFYVSVPSSAGAPYGNSVVPVDPATGALGTPISVGSEPNKMAISSDGTILWVGLDGASAVRQVNLTNATAGLQFSIAGSNGGVYQNPGTALALAALPGAPNSVVVSATNEFSDLSLAIFDNGVLRGAATPANYSYSSGYALQVNGTLGEVYEGGTGYNTYTYSSTGLTLKATSKTSATYASSSNDEMQIAGGQLYGDFGQVFDPESGSLLGTFYETGTTVAAGTTVADTTLGLAFVLDSSTGATYNGYNQIQAFNLSNYALASAAAIPISVPYQAAYTNNPTPSRLTRWGTNGLAFRTNAGVYSVRSNVVKNLSSTIADLGVAIAVTGSTTTGGNTTYTATVTNNGPSASTNVALTAQIPSTGVLVSVTPSTGSCSAATGVSCDLGSIASGASATVSMVVLETSAGTATLSAQVSGSEMDSSLSNNQASASATITGSAYAVVPALKSISPTGIQAGATDTVLTVTGTGFSSGATVYLGSTALATSFTSSTTLSATVPSAQLASMGWGAVTVSNPAPGGGASNALPLTVFSVITLGVNHILYDPYSQNIMASVGSGSTAVTGNSIVAITPSTATVGTAVPIGSQPTNLALTSDGQILYTILAGSESVARYNMLTQAADFTYTVPTNSSFDGGIALRGISAQPGTENTIALDIASFTGNAIYDFNPATKTAAIRGQASGPYSGSCISFLDAGDLLAFDTETSGATLDHYTVTSAGFTYYNYSQYSESTLNHFGCFKLSGGLAFANAGGVANPATVPATQLGEFPVSGGGTFSVSNAFAPDASLKRAFYLAETGSASTNVDGLQAYNGTTFLPTNSVFLNIPSIEGSTSYTGVDVIRWGQDGLALLTSGGHIYLLRGAAVVPGLLGQSSAAVLTSSATTSITHGAGNTLLTLTGSNFLPGVAVTWNGSYRTTTIVDATHVTVAIPASDLSSAGSGSLVATNPGASASGALTVTIN
jgi:hypothetical protein